MISVTQIGWDKRHVVSPFDNNGKVQTLCGKCLTHIPILDNISYMGLCSKCDKMRSSLTKKMSSGRWKHTSETKKIVYGGRDKIKRFYFDKIVDKCNNDVMEFVFALIVELDQKC